MYKVSAMYLIKNTILKYKMQAFRRFNLRFWHLVRCAALGHTASTFILEVDQEIEHKLSGGGS